MACHESPAKEKNRTAQFLELTLNNIYNYMFYICFVVNVRPLHNQAMMGLVNI